MTKMQDEAVGLDEDWLEEVISDSLDVDWRPRDAARAIMARLGEVMPQAARIEALEGALREIANHAASGRQMIGIARAALSETSK